MIDLYSLHLGPSPNVYKVMLLLEELELPYRIIPIDIFNGEQFSAEFLRICENNKVPAIVDHAPADGGPPVRVFESGSIMVYLADNAGRFLPGPSAFRERTEVLTWTFWQMGGFGPNAGQFGHFAYYAKEKIPYAVNRFTNELNRLFAVLDRRLAASPWVGGEDYSIADMINFASTHDYAMFGFDMAPFPNFLAWHARIKERPAYARTYLRTDITRTNPSDAENMTPDQWNLVFAQTAETLTAGR